MTTHLNDACLVLNRNWQAVAFLPLKTCIVTVMRDQARVLDVQDYQLLTLEEWVELGRQSDRMIRTARAPIAAFEVIVLQKYGERPPRKVCFTRQNLYRRDNYECQYCGEHLPRGGLTMDHVTPRSRGGGTTWTNIVAACTFCNVEKADSTPDEAGMRLRSQPQQPKWKPTLALPRNSKMLPSWATFLKKEAVG